jgi:hypothetical protein
MKVTRFFLSVLLLGATATMSHAAPSASIDWQTCASAIDRTPVAGPGQKINVSVIGQTDLHKAYDARVTFGSPGGLRDAWRFDTDGCQTGLLVMNQVDAKTCPAFQQAGTGALQIKKFTYDPATGKIVGLLADAYQAVSSVNAAQRYLLSSYNFDMTYAAPGPTDPGVTCGGVEVPMCAHITYATWLTLDGTEVPFAIAKEFVTSNDPANSSGCPGATPATAKTWGSLKSQYRN